MYHYSLHQWMLFFFIYCFLGWVWETCYVSAKQKHWVNRGFMKGPFLPIYGSGALAILIATLPVRNVPVLVYVFGLIGATLLELVTGICMEKMFHVRYWDYSYQKFNYKGHICLTSSIAWGAFSLAMIYGFHKPIESAVLQIPDMILDVVTTIITIIVAGDFAVSFKTAMELRDILDNLEKVKDEMKRLQKRAEVMEAFIADDLQNAKESFLEEMQEKTESLLDGVNEYKEDLFDEIKLKKEEASKQLKEIREKQKLYSEKAIHMMQNNRAISNLLRRNPSAISKHHELAFAEYKARVIETIKKEISERKSERENN